MAFAFSILVVSVACTLLCRIICCIFPDTTEQAAVVGCHILGRTTFYPGLDR